MRPLLLILSILTCYVDACAQWKRIYLPTSNDLYDVQIIDSICYTVGNSAAVLKSTDTGKSWKSLSLTIPVNLRALYFSDKDTGFVIGENARIQKTMDGGKTWSQKYVRTAAYGYDITFLNDYGLAVGKDMLAISTIDRGETWRVDTTLSRFKKLNSVTILPYGKCWAVGDSGYILTKNITERKWKVTKYPTKVDLNHVSHTSSGAIVITGGMPDSAIVGKFYNILLVSYDTGKTWQQSTVSEMKIINTTIFFSGDTGLLVGSNGLISKCNGFSNRGLQITGTPSSLNQVDFEGEVGLVAGDGGMMLRTLNRGGWGAGVENIDKDNSIRIVPNPGNGSFYLQNSAGDCEVSVYDMEGRLIYFNEAYTNPEMIHINETGVFNVVIRMESGRLTMTKLVVIAQ